MRSRVAKTLGLVVALAACVGMTVFAAPSPSASTPIKSATAKDANGNSVNLTITSTIPAQYAAAVSEIKTEAGLKAVLGGDFNGNMTVADVKEVTAPADAVFPLDITFAMNGVTANTKAIVLHYEDGAWVKMDTSTADGAVIGKGFKSLSPVAIVVDKTTLSSGATTSPKTSASAVSAIAVVGLAAVAGVCGLKKKSNAK